MPTIISDGHTSTKTRIVLLNRAKNNRTKNFEVFSDVLDITIIHGVYTPIVIVEALEKEYKRNPDDDFHVLSVIEVAEDTHDLTQKQTNVNSPLVMFLLPFEEDTNYIFN